MGNTSLITFVLAIVDIAIILFTALPIYGIFSKKIYALGRWYYKDQEASGYWQVIIGFIFFAATAVFMRFWILGPRLLG